MKAEIIWVLLIIFFFLVASSEIGRLHLYQEGVNPEYCGGIINLPFFVQIEKAWNDWGLIATPIICVGGLG